MNQEQLGSLARTLVQMICAGFITKGVLSETDAYTIQSAAEIAVPGIIALGVTWYGSLFKRNRENLVKAAIKVQKSERGTSRLEV